MLDVAVHVKLREMEKYAGVVHVEADMNTKLDWVLAKLVQLDCLEDKLHRLEEKSIIVSPDFKK